MYEVRYHDTGEPAVLEGRVWEIPVLPRELRRMKSVVMIRCFVDYVGDRRGREFYDVGSVFVESVVGNEAKEEQGYGLRFVARSREDLRGLIKEELDFPYDNFRIIRLKAKGVSRKVLRALADVCVREG